VTDSDKTDRAADEDVPDPAPASSDRKSREHVRKVVAAIAMGILTVGIIAGDYLLIGLDLLFIAAVTVLSMWSMVEFYRLCRVRGTTPFTGFGVACGGVLTVLHWMALPGMPEWFIDTLGLSAGASRLLRQIVSADLVALVLVVAILGSLWLQATKRDNDRAFESISTTLFGILYVWFLASFLVKLRHLGADGVVGGRNWPVVGHGLLFSHLAASKLADVGGYLFGRKFGRHRLIPRISPKKSYEGLIAGLALSVASGFILRSIGWLPFGAWWQVLLFSLLVGGMGVLGDLAESLLKRGSGRKDAGDYIPGFGGVLDVVDSVLLSAPVGYFLALVLLRW
jgi:phosphatidate cytidylyltransferase